MKITEEYQARFEKILEQIEQHVQMLIPEEEINVIDTFRTSIVLYLTSIIIATSE